MAGAGSTAAPTLSVTGVLALLWVLAAVQAGPDGPAAVALDPGRAGSIGEWWANALLVVALLVAVALPGSRSLALLPAALLAGEVGELHIHVANLLAAATGGQQNLPMLKAVASLALGGVALGAVLRSRHHSCYRGLVLVLVGGGTLSLLLDARHPPGLVGAWCAGVEEWIEVALYSVVAASILAVRKSRIGTMSRAIVCGSRVAIGDLGAEAG